MSEKADVIMNKIAVAYGSLGKAQSSLRKHFKSGDPEVTKKEYLEAGKKSHERVMKYITPGMAGLGALAGGLEGYVEKPGIKGALIGAGIGATVSGALGYATKRHVNNLKQRNPKYLDEQFGAQYDSMQSYLKSKYGKR